MHLRCPCIAVVYTPMRQRSYLILKVREDAQTATIEQQRLPGATLHVQAPEGLQGSISLIFSQTIQDNQGKDALGPERKCLGGKPPRLYLSLHPSIHLANSAVHSEVTGDGWGHLTS